MEEMTRQTGQGDTSLSHEVLPLQSFRGGG